MDYNLQDTIAAIATAYGEAAISIIRLSGKKAISLTETFFSKSLQNSQSHTIKYGQILNKKKEIIDNVLLLIMKSPNSYTKEDCIEIHCHGGILITKKVFETVLKAGARAANPGEFTFRAYKNGKIDLSQAEAIQQLIHAKSELAAKEASKQLNGRLAEAIKSFQKRLLDTYAIFEAYVDFPEDDLDIYDEKKNFVYLEDIIKDMKKLNDTFDDGGKSLFETSKFILVGSPNVGKSSIMNLLIGEDRSIITDIPGTTTDVIKENINIKDVNLQIIDTAGIRQATTRIEEEGIKKTKENIALSDFILLVLDNTNKLNEEDEKLIKSYDSEKTIIIYNKIDLNKKILKRDNSNITYFSAKTQEGLSKLKEMMRQMMLKKMPSKEGVLITNVRHKKAIEQAIEYAEKVLIGMKKKISLECLIIDIKRSLSFLSSIIEIDIDEEVLDLIFSKFCIGK